MITFLTANQIGNLGAFVRRMQIVCSMFHIVSFYLITLPDTHSLEIFFLTYLVKVLSLKYTENDGEVRIWQSNLVLKLYLIVIAYTPGIITRTRFVASEFYV